MKRNTSPSRLPNLAKVAGSNAKIMDKMNNKPSSNELAVAYADNNYPFCDYKDAKVRRMVTDFRNVSVDSYIVGYEAGYLQGLKDAKHLPENPES